MKRPFDDQQIRRYLLAELEGYERTAFDEEILGNDEFFEVVQAVEDELIDEYVLEDLSPAERERFETYFLTTADRRRRTELARLLRERATRVGRSSWVWWARAAAVLVALLIPGAILMWNRQPSSPVPRADAPASPATPSVSTPAAPDAPDAAAVAVVALASGSLRDLQGAAPVTIGPEVGTLRLQLELAPDLVAAPNVVSIETPDGGVVWTSSISAQPAPESDTLPVDVPADVLGAGDYLVVLYLDDAGRRDTVAEYTLSIRRGSRQ